MVSISSLLSNDTDKKSDTNGNSTPSTSANYTPARSSRILLSSIVNSTTDDAVHYGPDAYNSHSSYKNNASGSDGSVPIHLKPISIADILLPNTGYNDNKNINGTQATPLPETNANTPSAEEANDVNPKSVKTANSDLIFVEDPSVNTLAPAPLKAATATAKPRKPRQKRKAKDEEPNKPKRQRKTKAQKEKEAQEAVAAAATVAGENKEVIVIGETTDPEIRPPLTEDKLSHQNQQASGDISDAASLTPVPESKGITWKKSAQSKDSTKTTSTTTGKKPKKEPVSGSATPAASTGNAGRKTKKSAAKKDKGENSIGDKSRKSSVKATSPPKNPLLHIEKPHAVENSTSTSSALGKPKVIGVRLEEKPKLAVHEKRDAADATEKQEDLKKESSQVSSGPTSIIPFFNQSPSPAIKKERSAEPRLTKLSDLLNSKSDEEEPIIEVIVDDEEDIEEEEEEEEDDDEEDDDVDVDAEVEVDDEDDADFENYEENAKKKEEIPLVFDVPLNKMDEKGNNDLGKGQVIINVMKLAEEKYGFKTIHPNANFALDALRDDLFDDEDGANDSSLVTGGNSEKKNNDLLKEFKKNQLKLQKEKEEQLQQQLELQQEQNDLENLKESEEKIRKMIARNNRKIGKYDYNDPFIDDAELYWEETRAVTKDGFFIYWGSLVEDTPTGTGHGYYGASNNRALTSKDPTKYINKAGKLVKKYRSKPGPKSKKEKEMIERERQLQLQAERANSK